MPRCPDPEETEQGDVCVAITDCSIPRCENGFCIIVDGVWRCDCDPGWNGETCDSQGPPHPPVPAAAASFITEGIITIVICLAVLLSEYSFINVLSTETPEEDKCGHLSYQANSPL